MRLTRIRIEQFKQFRQAIEIRGLEPGLNLFTGPNESGKSTIVSAIRAAFFERHRSGSVDDLRPWGDGSGSPTVEIDFEIGSSAYRLSKSFLGRKRCELQVGTRRLDGNDAEDHLAQLLGFQLAGKGVSKAEHWGIPGLLWIQQGRAQDVRESVSHATDHLRTALNESLGEVASSAGDEVLAIVENARNELLTAAAGKPRGIYLDALDQSAALAAAVQEIDAEVIAYRHKVDTLAALRREHADDTVEKPWEDFRRQQREALARLEAIRQVEASLASERVRAAQLDDRVKLLRDQLDGLAAQELMLDRRNAVQTSAREALSAATALVGEWTLRRREAAARHEAVRAALRDVRLEDTRRALARQAEEIALKLRSSAEALTRAEAEQLRLADLQRQAAATGIDGGDLKALRDQDRRMRELLIHQAAAATRVEFALEAGCSIRVGGEDLSGSGERLLLEASTIELPGLGTLRIVPGGEDLSELRRSGTELADRHAAVLHRIGLTSLEAAEARQQAHGQWLADIKTAEATLRALAPQGVDTLRAELVALRVRAGEIEQTLNRLPPAAHGGTALQSISEAEAAEEAAGKSLAGISDSLHAAQLTAANAQSALDAATRELANARALLDDPERVERVARANRDLVDARAEQFTLAARIEDLREQVAAARPDILNQDVERFRRSAEQMEVRFSERRDALMRLEVELQGAGARGLDERRAELARDLAGAQRRVAELRRRANALDHLLTLLRDKRRTLTRRLQAPLQRHLNRYLQLLFPQARLEIDENLSPGPLTRAGAGGPESGDFEALSFGAREQMGVISRLAYADLLQEAGRPTLVILDDALVHSDELRLAQMKRVLFDASLRHQILLFTCHPANWRDLGVAARSLQSLAAGGGEAAELRP